MSCANTRDIFFAGKFEKNGYMNVQEAYNNWAGQYDTNNNKTRDLEARALRASLAAVSFQHCLEIGCGTGKNTVWLREKASRVTAVDLSEEMLAKARAKISSPNVQFVQADITKPWRFANKTYDLVSFSLVLEHIEDLGAIFEKAANVLQSGGYMYIGELHPFKQYTGTKARFETESGTQVVTCFNHHVSEFVQEAKKHGFRLTDMNEYFDEDQKEIPRILTIILKKI
jgi:ubiquinone/menaquinone biosynthesis C-methylase UbiE